MVATDPLRIALDGHVVGRRQTGNETYLVNLAEALAGRDDIDVTVYVDAEARWPNDASVRLGRLQARSPFLRVPIELPMRARRAGAQLLHVQYVAPPAPRLPVVTTIHDVSFEDLERAFPNRMTLRLKATVRWAAMRSSAVIASSSYTRDRILHHYRIDPSRIHVAPLGVHPRWRPLEPAERSQLTAPLGLPERFVLAVGNVHPRKNLPRLVRAMQAVRAAGSDLDLVLVGQRHWRAGDLDAAIREADAGEWVRFTGYVSDDVLQALYGTATLVAYPSIYEGFGLPVLEAMACGAPVVASATTSIPEVAGDAGLLVDPTDVEALASAIVAIATNDAFRERLRQASLDRAARFTWQACADATVAAYRAALAT